MTTVLPAYAQLREGIWRAVGRERHPLSPIPRLVRKMTHLIEHEPSAGFPNSGVATAVPNQFFARVLPQVECVEELVVSLYFFFAQQFKRRSPRYLTKRELAADATLASALARLATGEDALARLATGEDALARGLDLSVWRGTLLRAHTRSAGREEELYVVNNPQNRKALEEMMGGEFSPDDTLPPANADNSSSIFALYEQNIRPLTPLIAEELAEAEKRYPAGWVRDAFREAVELNKPNWRYIESILRRWEAEGRPHEKSGRDPEVEWAERRYREGKRRLGTGRRS